MSFTINIQELIDVESELLSMSEGMIDTFMNNLNKGQRLIYGKRID